MATDGQETLEQFMNGVRQRNPGGRVRVNRGYRVQNSNAIGPYKGGIRFHQSVNLSILKFLAFEQTFKNALTGLPLGGGKGGSDFDPRGKSEREIMRFCQAFMTELYRHVGADTDVPAGDIGVGEREIGFLFGQYKRLTNSFTAALTGKGLEYGGSPVRKEATGYGTVYMMHHMLDRLGRGLEGHTCLVSGAGNVATYAVEKLIDMGARVVTMSDSTGFVHDEQGLNGEKLEFVKELKKGEHRSLEALASEYGLKFFADQKPWKVPCDFAFPCATQNEISLDDARCLIENGCAGVAEGANMPAEHEAVQAFLEAKILFAPSKAANAGGVAVSGLEIEQNRARTTWKNEELQSLLREIMRDIHDCCVRYGESADREHINYVRGANIAGFVRVADAMVAYGIV